MEYSFTKINKMCPADRIPVSYTHLDVYKRQVIGIAVGLVLGTFLKNFILSVAELESMMFAPETDVWSYVFSAGLTLAFTFLVNGLFFFKLRRLNMAESMKSVE